MHGATGVDPNASVSVEALLAAAFEAVLARWDSFEPVTLADPALLEREGPILEMVERLSPSGTAQLLRTALTAGDPKALRALIELNNHIWMASEALLERCKEWKRIGDWPALAREGVLAARLAKAAGRHGQRARVLMLVAAAHRTRGDSVGMIPVYEEAIEAASAANDKQVLSLAHDNLGKVLADVGRLDDALAHYVEALLHEENPKNVNIIMANKANALVRMGELRKAARTHRDMLAKLERAGMTGRELAIALDSTGSALFALGETAAALTMFERARTLFSPEHFADRSINALGRAKAHSVLGDKVASAAAFRDAHDLALANARQVIRPEHYLAGLRSSLTHRLPPDDEAHALLVEGVKVRETGAPARALELWQRAENRARAAGDHRLALRVEANQAALLSDLGQVDHALRIASRVQHEAGGRGLARPELMVTSTLGSLAATGADIGDPLGSLGCYARCAILREVLDQTIPDVGLDRAEAAYETYDPGTLDNELALLAGSHHADDLAVQYYTGAIAKARLGDAKYQLANRLAGLRTVLARSGKAQEAELAVVQLTALLSAGDLPPLGVIVAHRELGAHFAESDRTLAIHHLRMACQQVEALRETIPAGTRRADVDRQFSRLSYTLARLLRVAGDHRGALEALQGGKGRRLIAALSARAPSSGAHSDSPPKFAELVELLDHLSPDVPTVLVDLAVEDDGLTAYVLQDGAVKALHVTGEIAKLATAEQGDVIEREQHIVDLCLHDPLLHQLAVTVTNEIPAGSRLLVAPDRLLYNLPLHIIPTHTQHWCDTFPISYVPALGALRFTATRQSSRDDSLVAGDSREDLPHAAEECRRIAMMLGTKPLLGPACTRTAIETRLRAGSLDVVHLAVHAQGDPRRGVRAGLLLADDSGGTEWVDFDALTGLAWQARLVVFSGCSTNVAGPSLSNQLVSVASSALEAGAAVIACLWPVHDDAAHVLMVAFYESLARRRPAGAVDLRNVLDDARVTLRQWLASAPATADGRRRDGRTHSEALRDRHDSNSPDRTLFDSMRWGPFVLMGHPILRG